MGKTTRLVECSVCHKKVNAQGIGGHMMLQHKQTIKRMGGGVANADVELLQKQMEIYKSALHVLQGKFEVEQRKIIMPSLEAIKDTIKAEVRIALVEERNAEKTLRNERIKTKKEAEQSLFSLEKDWKEVKEGTRAQYANSGRLDVWEKMVKEDEISINEKRERLKKIIHQMDFLLNTAGI